MNYTSVHTHCHTHAHSFMLYLGIEYWFHASCETDRDDLKHYVKCWGETAHWFPRRPRQRSQSSSWVEVCSYPSLCCTDINESFHLINLEAERFNADVLSCMMTGIIKLEKKSSHTHTHTIDSRCGKWLCEGSQHSRMWSFSTRRFHYSVRRHKVIVHPTQNMVCLTFLSIMVCFVFVHECVQSFFLSKQQKFKQNRLI